MIYLEDTFLDHPKMVLAGDDAVAMWLRGMAWLKQQRSSTGRIPKAIVKARCAPIFGGKALAPEPIMRRLIEVGSWDDDGESIVVHGYVERNEASIQRSEIARGKAEKRWSKERERRQSHANGDAAADAPALPQQVPQQAASRCPSTNPADATVHSPQSPTGNKSSSSLETGESRPVEEEDGYADRPKAACVILAARALKARRGEPLNDPRSWVAKVTEDRLAEHGRALAAALERDADLTAHQLAALIEAGGPKPPPKARCEHCVGGWVTPDLGEGVIPCTHCRGPKARAALGR